MGDTLGPVVANAAMRGTRWVEIDAFRPAPCQAGFRDLPGSAADDDEPATNQGVAQQYAEPTRQMTVASAHPAQFLAEQRALAVSGFHLGGEIDKALDQ